MRKTLSTITVILVFLVSMSAMAIPAAGMGGFSAAPNHPENQNPDSTFFDLMVTSGGTQEISISVRNQIEREITVSIELISASTNRHGAIDYHGTGKLDEETLINGFAEMATVVGLAEDGLVTIPAGLVANVPIRIDLPAQGFDGIILGSILITEELTEQQLAEGGMIVNRAAFVLPIRLQQGEWNPDIAMGDDSFALGEIYTTLSNYRAAVVIDLRHAEPRISRWATVDARIYPQGGNEPMYEELGMEAEFAPNSIMPITFRPGEAIVPGNYIARVRVELDGRIWNLESPFTITAGDAAGVNEGAVELRPDPVETPNLPTWVIICIIIVVLIIVVGMFFVLKKNRTQDDKEKALEQLKSMDQEELMRLVEQVQQQEQPEPEDKPEN